MFKSRLCGGEASRRWWPEERAPGQERQWLCYGPKVTCLADFLYQVFDLTLVDVTVAGKSNNLACCGIPLTSL